MHRLARGPIPDFQVVEVTVVTFTCMKNQSFLLCNILIGNKDTGNLVFLITFDGYFGDGC